MCIYVNVSDKLVSYLSDCGASHGYFFIVIFLSFVFPLSYRKWASITEGFSRKRLKVLEKRATAAPSTTRWSALMLSPMTVTGVGCSAAAARSPSLCPCMTSSACRCEYRGNTRILPRARIATCGTRTTGTT